MYLKVSSKVICTVQNQTNRLPEEEIEFPVRRAEEKIKAVEKWKEGEQEGEMVLYLWISKTTHTFTHGQPNK